MCTTRSSGGGKPPTLGSWALYSRNAAILCLPWLLHACASAAPPSTAAASPASSIAVSELTVRDIQAAYASGEFTAVELTRAFLDRIDRYESHYNALISMNPDALTTAAALDEEYASRGPRGPLHGVPVVIKDNLDYGGLVTTAGFSGFSVGAVGGSFGWLYCRLGNRVENVLDAVTLLEAMLAATSPETNFVQSGPFLIR